MLRNIYKKNENKENDNKNSVFLHPRIDLKIPIRGTASEVVGIDSATRFKKTVNDRRIVTPGKVI